MVLMSIDYFSEVSEFEKVGLILVLADFVSLMCVEEFLVQLECKVKEIILFGELGGVGYFIICEVVRMYIYEQVLDEDGKINLYKIDFMGCMGCVFYVWVSGEVIYKIFQFFNV